MAGVFQFVFGLSPRVRGKLGRLVAQTGIQGSIPACAGEAKMVMSGRMPPEVYPRVCGGSELSHHGMDNVVGLSPRVRGKRDELSARHRAERSIPACAGEAGAKPPGRAAPVVYPRVCGGSHWLRLAIFRSRGLSPRVRGKPLYWWGWR